MELNKKQHEAYKMDEDVKAAEQELKAAQEAVVQDLKVFRAFQEAVRDSKNLRTLQTSETPVDDRKDGLKVEYPEVFYTGVLNYEGSTHVKKLKACRDALIAWGPSHIPPDPPKFGEAMVLLREFLEASSALPEGFLEASDRLLDSNSRQQV